MSLNIVALLPSLMNINGDAENARVLAQRASWAGLDPKLYWVDDVAELPDRVDAVVLGSGADSDLPHARKALLPVIERVRAWPTERVALLAVGSGWELLSWGIEFDSGEIVEGLGVFAGRALPAPERSLGDLVVDSQWGQLLGFENHARDYVGAERSSIGSVRFGSGNGIPQASGRRHEGVLMGTAIGTHLHGPVCAKNPALADHLLTAAAAHAGIDYRRSAAADRVDGWADAARTRILNTLDLNGS